MSRYQPPGRRSAAGGGAPRRSRIEDTLPGMQFPVVEDLGRITADDEFLDAIASGGADLRSVFAGSGANAAGSPFSPFDGSAGVRRPVGLGPLLIAWRSELLELPLPALPTLAPRLMLAPADRSRRRSMRSLLSVAAAICALLMASTVVGAHSAQPGQPLWGLTQVLWSEHAHSIEAKVKVEAAIGFARKALKDGDAKKAQAVLDGLDGEVDKVLTADGREALQHNLAKIQEEVGVVVGSDGPGDIDTANLAAAGGPASSSGGRLIPPVAIGSDKAHTTAPTPSVSKTGAVAPPTTADGSNVADGGGAGPTGNPPKSVTDLPIVPVIPATTSSPGAPAKPGTTSGPGPVVGPGTTAGPTAPGTTAGTTAPVDPTTPAPVETTAPATPAPDTTPGPVDTPTPTDAATTPADPSTTDAPTTDDPSTSNPEPSTTDDPTTTAGPTEETTPDPTSASTTSEIPTTLETTPSTDSDGSTTGEPSSTTTQTAPVNSTDGTSSVEATENSDDPGNDPASQSGETSTTTSSDNG